MELIITIAPPWPSATICFAPSVQTTHAPRTFVSNSSLKSSILVSSQGMNGLMAAFETM